VTVRVRTTSGTAGTGDFTAVDQVVTIPAGATSAAVTIYLKNDKKAESTETFTVTLSSPTRATIAVGTATIIITDDDGTASGAIVPLIGSSTGAAPPTAAGSPELVHSNVTVITETGAALTTNEAVQMTGPELGVVTSPENEPTIALGSLPSLLSAVAMSMIGMLATVRIDLRNASPSPALAFILLMLLAGLAGARGGRGAGSSERTPRAST
jgi:hypothetical protein